MTTREKIIRKSIAEVERQIEKLKTTIYATPVSAIIDGRIKAQQIIEENKGDYKTIAKLIEPLALEEGRLFALAEKQKEKNLINKLVALQSELSDLKNELYMIDGK